jgi:hypothetical protein
MSKQILSSVDRLFLSLVLSPCSSSFFSLLPPESSNNLGHRWLISRLAYFTLPDLQTIFECANGTLPDRRSLFFDFFFDRFYRHLYFFIVIWNS